MGTEHRSVASWRISSLATSAEGVYGLIVVAGMIVVSRNLTGTSAEALFAVIATLLVFFAAHVYAATVARLAVPGDGGVGNAVRHGVHESLGLLVVGAIPVLVLALGVLGVMKHSEAVWVALAVDGALLGVLGWFITAARTPNLWARIGGAVLTAGFGALMILLKAMIH
ncbi:MAG: hypothetical protein WA971_07575 [Microbacterium sp.]